jgi:hypothetical protein
LPLCCITLNKTAAIILLRQDVALSKDFNNDDHNRDDSDGDDKDAHNLFLHNIRLQQTLT